MSTFILSSLLCIAKSTLVFALLAAVWAAVIRAITQYKIQIRRVKSDAPVIESFHPAADACGGGEKVLM